MCCVVLCCVVLCCVSGLVPSLRPTNCDLIPGNPEFLTFDREPRTVDNGQQIQRSGVLILTDTKLMQLCSSVRDCRSIFFKIRFLVFLPIIDKNLL